MYGRKDLGVKVSRRMFAPRFGLAFRATDTFVIRGGYGLTNDPYSMARSMRSNYSVIIELDRNSPNSWQPLGPDKLVVAGICGKIASATPDLYYLLFKTGVPKIFWTTVVTGYTFALTFLMFLGSIKKGAGECRPRGR